MEGKRNNENKAVKSEGGRTADVSYIGRIRESEEKNLNKCNYKSVTKKDLRKMTKLPKQVERLRLMNRGSEIE